MRMSLCALDWERALLDAKMYFMHVIASSKNMSQVRLGCTVVAHI